MQLIRRYIGSIKNAIRVLTDPYIEEFIHHNKKIWDKQSYETENEILIQIGGVPRQVATWAYFANALSERFCAKMYSYAAIKGSQINEYSEKKIYKSFGCRGHICVSLTNDEKKMCKRKAHDIFASLKTKEDLLDLQINGIKVGEEIYDAYLRKGNPTANYADIELESLLEEAVRIVFFWSEYFSTHKVKAVIKDTDPYMNCIVGNVACSYGINVYSIGMGWGVKHSVQYAWYEQYKYYHVLYRQVPHDLQLRGIEWAKEQLERRFNGEIGVDINNVTTSAFSKNSSPQKRVLGQSGKIKILIAPHDFFDAPHRAGGRGLFPDFYEWLCHLGELSEQTDYEWYIKVHPNASKLTISTIKNLLTRYSQIHWIENNISHHQLIAEGIQVVLTVYGTVGCEYPLFDIPVINAGYNPHISYSFNAHPKTIQEYDEIILHLDQFHLHIENKDVYEFYFMHHIFGLTESPYRCRDNLVVHSIDSFVNALQGRWDSTWEYHYFVKDFSEEWHKTAMGIVKEYIDFMDSYCANRINIDSKCRERILARLKGKKK